MIANMWNVLPTGPLELLKKGFLEVCSSFNLWHPGAGNDSSTARAGASGAFGVMFQDLRILPSGNLASGNVTQL